MQNALGSLKSITVYSLSERAVSIEFKQEISERTLADVRRYDSYIAQHPFPGFTTTVPAYASLTIHFDPLIVINSDLPGSDCFDKVSGYVQDINPVSMMNGTENEIMTIPVCYDQEFGPDLTELAAMHQLSINEVISLHSKVIYTVYMIGFVPGFTYLGGMDDLLTTPRLSIPRQAVPAGSVGIAGHQTGIYPFQTPGGWQIIGRTPVKIFDADREQPSLLKAGDRVKFEPVDVEAFHQLSRL